MLSSCTLAVVLVPAFADHFNYHAEPSNFLGDLFSVRSCLQDLQKMMRKSAKVSRLSPILHLVGVVREIVDAVDELNGIALNCI
jgi:hypothetical protein